MRAHSYPVRTVFYHRSENYQQIQQFSPLCKIGPGLPQIVAIVLQGSILRASNVYAKSDIQVYLTPTLASSDLRLLEKLIRLKTVLYLVDTGLSSVWDEDADPDICPHNAGEHAAFPRGSSWDAVDKVMCGFAFDPFQGIRNI